jgi:acetolactate decarboxylase
MNFKTSIVGLIILTSISNTTKAQLATNEVKIVGQMKNVMWKGQLYGNISLDTIADKTNLYGLGPVEYLAGEIAIINSQSFTSIVT